MILNDGNSAIASQPDEERPRFADQPIRSKTSFKIIGKKEGLPSGQVHRIAQDGQDSLWFATPLGVAKFDGHRVTVLDRKSGLSTHGVRCVAAGQDLVWIGSDLGIDVLALDGGMRFSLSETKWKHGFVECILPLDDGGAFIGTARGLVRWFPSGSVELQYSGLIRTIHRDTKGRIWAAGPSSGLMSFDGDDWTPLPEGEFASVGHVLGLADARDGRGLLVACERGLLETDQEGQVVRSLGTGGLAETVTAALATDNELWLGIAGEFRTYREVDGEWQREQVVMTHCRINHLFHDRFGNVWAGSDSLGAIKISALRNAIIRPEIPDSGSVYSIRPTPSGDILVGDIRHCWRIRLGDPVVATRLHGSEMDKVWDVLDDGGLDIWAATQAGIVRWKPGGEPIEIGDDHEVLSGPGRVLLERKDGIWVGTQTGLAVVRGDSISTVRTDKDGPLGYVYTLTEDLSGRLWVGTIGNGLFREGPSGRLSRVASPHLTDAGNVYAIALRDDGALAVLQDNNIVFIDAQSNSRLVAETEDAVSGWAARFIGPGRLLIGSSSGLSEFDVETGDVIRRLISPQGESPWEFTTSRSMVLHDDVRLLCGLSSGLTIVDLAALDAFQERPLVRLTEVDWTGADVETTDDGFFVRPGKWTLRVNLHTNWFIDEDTIQFSHLLVGFDKTWSDPSRLAQIQYNSLPSGEYTLKVRAFSPLVGWGAEVEILNLRVAEPIWFRGWIANALNLGDAVRNFAQARWRNRRLTEENEDLERTIRDRTRQIEETNTALRSLNDELRKMSLVDVLTGVANRRHFNEFLEKEYKRSLRAGSPLAVLLLDVDHFKKYNDTFGHGRGDECLRTVAEALTHALRDSGDFVARYGGEEFAIILPGTDLSGAEVTAERVRRAIESLGLDHVPNETGRVVTISLGVAASSSFPDGQIPNTNALILAADQALYRAKRAGRNRWSSAAVPV